MMHQYTSKYYPKRHILFQKLGIVKSDGSSNEQDGDEKILNNDSDTAPNKILSSTNKGMDDNDNDNGNAQDVVDGDSAIEATSNTTAASRQKSKDGVVAVIALDILQYLLEHNIVTEESVTAAYNVVTTETSTAGTVPPETIQNDSACMTVDNGLTRSEANVDVEQQQQQQEKEKKKGSTPDEDNNQKRKRHIAFKIYYNGVDYNGLAEQVGHPNDKSIEREVFKALRAARLIDGDRTSSSIKYSRCGRTDKGVSANGQVLAFELNSAFAITATADEEGLVPLNEQDLPTNGYESKTIWTIPRNKKAKKNKNKKDKQKQNAKTNANDDNMEEDDTNTATTPPSPIRRVQRAVKEYSYDKILNNLLPPDIRVYGWCPVSDEFSARFSATTRTYRYFFVKTPSLDIELMRQGLDSMVGTHDFRNLCKINVEAVYNFVRTIHHARIVQVHNNNDENGINDDDNHNHLQSQIYYFEIVGQAFLWHQIRCIVSVLFMVGRGLEHPTVVQELLNVEKHPGKPSYDLAAPEPLVLHECAFQNLQLNYSVLNLWTLQCHQQQLWQDAMIQAARVYNSISSMKDDPSVRVLSDDLISFVDGKLRERNRKREKNGGQYEQSVLLPLDSSVPSSLAGGSNYLSWSDALRWMQETYSLVPEAYGTKETAHTPLLQRHKGSTYEEKVASIQSSTTSQKRKQRYEENVVKKRKSKEEDKAFYEHKTKQGSTSVATEIAER